MSELLLGLEDGGREVSVHPGDRVLLRLPENPTTGYRWQGSFPAGLRIARDQNIVGEPAPGAASMREFEFAPSAPGRYQLSLTRSQAWEGGAAGDARFDLVLTVD